MRHHERYIYVPETDSWTIIVNGRRVYANITTAMAAYVVEQCQLDGPYGRLGDFGGPLPPAGKADPFCQEDSP